MHTAVLKKQQKKRSRFDKKRSRNARETLIVLYIVPPSLLVQMYPPSSSICLYNMLKQVGGTSTPGGGSRGTSTPCAVGGTRLLVRPQALPVAIQWPVVRRLALLPRSGLAWEPRFPKMSMLPLLHDVSNITWNHLTTKCPKRLVLLSVKCV